MVGVNDTTNDTNSSDVGYPGLQWGILPNKSIYPDVSYFVAFDDAIVLSA